MFTLSKTADRLNLNNPWNICIIYLGFGAGLAVFMFTGFMKSVPKMCIRDRLNVLYYVKKGEGAKCYDLILTGLHGSGKDHGSPLSALYLLLSLFHSYTIHNV